jgi:hypothetical protein
MTDTPPNDDAKDPFLAAEMADREQRKALQKKEIKEKLVEQDELEKVLSTSAIGEARAAKKKQIFKYGLWAAGGGVLVWLGMYLFAPYQAGVTYGICKVYLETTLRFPQELRVSTVEDFGDSVRLWYTQVDAFGEYRMESIQCYYKMDPQLGAQIDKILVNRRPVDLQKIKDFNKILPVVMANMPDLTYPSALPDSLNDLQIDTDLFRRQLRIDKR